MVPVYNAFLAHKPGNVPALMGLAGAYRLLGRAADAAALTERADALGAGA